MLAAAACPVLAVTLYFTFSRGGLAVAGVGLVVYIVAGHPRGLLPALVAIAPATYFALARAYDAQLLAGERFDQPLAAAEREDVLTAVIVCALAAAGLRALLLLADRALARIEVTRRRSGVALAALLLAMVGTAVALQVPERIDRERQELLRDEPVRGAQDLRGRLLQFQNNRADHWRVALDVYRDEPLHGSGAGTFQLAWERDRPSPPSKVRDAHSLYLEVLSELGWVGLLLLVVALGTPLVVAVARLWGPERHAHAAFLAGASALLVHAGIDWDWEMPALFLWFFAASGMVLAGAGGGPSPGRLTRVVAGLACLALVLTPALIYRSQRPFERSARALFEGDCRRAVDPALDSLDALPARAEPFEVLGYCDAKAGQHRLAVQRDGGGARARSGQLGVRVRPGGHAGAGRAGPGRGDRGCAAAEPARRARGRARARPAVAQPGAPPPGGRARGDPVRVERARMRDEDFERLYEAEAQGLFGFLAYRTGDRALAEDLLADTFERALRSRTRFNRRRGSPKTWLYAIALNLLRDHARRSAAAERALERTGPARGSGRRARRRRRAPRRHPARPGRPQPGGARGDRAALRRRADRAGDRRGAGRAADDRRGPRVPRAAQAPDRARLNGGPC